LQHKRWQGGAYLLELRALVWPENPCNNDAIQTWDAYIRTPTDLGWGFSAFDFHVDHYPSGFPG
jgi:hypothetical protein